jgi:hypothetical protein
MKSPVFVCSLIALLAGTGIGWLIHPEATPAAAGPLTGKAGTLTPALRNTEGGAGTGADGAVSGERSVADLVKAALEVSGAGNDRLDDAAFGAKLAALLTGKGTIEELVEAGGMKARLTPGRFVAFYKAYTLKKRISSGDMNVNTPLLKLGQEHGREMIALMTKDYPNGFNRIDSLIHGWAMSEPEQAVEWFNKLEDHYGQYDSALQGLMWGLAAKDGTMAGKVLQTLSPADQAKAVFGFASSFVDRQGLEAFDAWLKEAPASLAANATASAVQFVCYKPPEQHVPWLASHSDLLGIRGELRSGFDMWFGASAPQAMEWLAALPPEQEGVRSALLSRIKPEAAQRFMAENPSHPGTALLHPAK